MVHLPSAPADDGASGPAWISRRTVVAGTAWAVPAVVVASAAPAVAASTTCTPTVTVHPITCALNRTRPNVELQLALTFTTDCPPVVRDGIRYTATYFVFQSIGQGPGGINETFEVIPGRPSTKLFDIKLPSFDGYPRQLQINGVLQYPSGVQEQKSFLVNVPQGACCYPTTA